MLRRVLFAAGAALLLPGLARAQSQDTLSGTLPEVHIEAARASETEASAPFSVSVLTRGVETAALEPGLSLDDVLNPLPGLWVNDRGHFALGERIVVRGMGWRPQFGVRGVQILLDGIPLTMPDGQAIADIVDPAFIQRAELVRGPASLFWGNAAGGVLFLSTTPATHEPFARGRALAGSYGVRQLAGEVLLTPGPHRLHGYVSNTEQEGYRAYSEGRFTRAGLHGSVSLGARTRLGLMAAAADQDAQNPGSLTAAQVLDDPRMANARNVDLRTGKESTQIQAGATLLHDAGVGVLSATAYGLVRDFTNPIPSDYIDVGREAGGLRLAVQDEAGRIHWGIGVDGALQDDDRLEFANAQGAPGEVRLDQGETVANTAAFGYATVHATSRLAVTGGVRGDRVRFEIDDRLLGNGDDTGSRVFGAWSPSAGVSYRLTNALLFANYSSAFETPTTTELVNQPDGSGGFNPEIEPQRTHGVELGARGGWPAARLTYDAAAYVLSITNGLIPYQAANDGPTYYRNTGENRHAGVELALTWRPVPSGMAQLTYSGNRMTFEDDRLGGNRVPGVPDHRLYASLQGGRAGWWGRVATEAVSSYFVDDENTTRNEGFVTFDFYAGHEGIAVGTVRILPFFKVANVFDRAYSNSVVINAFGGRFFEPAPGRTVQAGLSLIL